MTLRLEEDALPQNAGAGPSHSGRGGRGLKTGDVFAGDTAFKLYDTYGFPLDLTQDALRARGVVVDTEAFSKAMDVQKTEARRAWKGTGEAQS